MEKISSDFAIGSGNNHEVPTPRVSIGLPVFNGEDYLAEALDSLLAQTCTDLEIIIGDNASTDGTSSICRAAADGDSRIRYIRHEENLGAAPNYNQVFAESRGEFFKWASHDDICAPNLIQDCLAVFDQRSDVALVAPRTRIIDAHGAKVKDLVDELELLEELPHERLCHFLEFHTWPQACNPVFGLMRREVLARTRLIDSYPASDMVLLARLALEGKLVLVPEYHFLRREHPNTSVKKFPDMKDRDAWFNPRRVNRVQMVNWRWFWEYLQIVRESSLGWSEKRRCGQEVMSWAIRIRSALLRDFKKIPASLQP